MDSIGIISAEQTLRGKINFPAASAGPDTSDSTAIAADLQAGKIAYGANGKIIGTLETKEGTIDSKAGEVIYGQMPDGSDSYITIKVNQEDKYIVDPDKELSFKIDGETLALLAGITPEKIKTGETIFGVHGNA